MKNLGIKSNHHCHDHHCHHWHFVRSSEWNNFCGVNILRNCLWKQKNKTHQHQHWYSWKKYLKGGQAWCMRIRSNGLRMIDGIARAVHGGAVWQVAHLWPNKEGQNAKLRLVRAGWFSQLLGDSAKKNWFKQQPNWKMRVGFKRNLNWKMVLCGTQHLKKCLLGHLKSWVMCIINCEILFRCSQKFPIFWYLTCHSAASKG